MNLQYVGGSGGILIRNTSYFLAGGGLCTPMLPFLGWGLYSTCYQNKVNLSAHFLETITEDIEVSVAVKHSHWSHINSICS